MDNYEIELSSEQNESSIFLQEGEIGETLDLSQETYQQVPVTSVNGKKGKVELTTEDIPNTSNYQTGNQVTNTVDQKITQHNNSSSAHPFLKDQISNVSSQVGAISAQVGNKQDRLVSGQNIKTINNESILGSGNLDIQGGTEDYNDLSNKPQITYTSTTVDSRTVTQTTVTETIDGTKPIGSYGAFNFIPLDMSHYTSSAANKALLPETHLPYGTYIVTEPGYMRLGNETKDLGKGALIYWYDSGELDLIGYNACEYWSYDTQTEEWSGGYFTTTDDVEYIVAEKIGWMMNSSALTGGTANMVDGRWSRRTRPTGINSLNIAFPSELPEYNYKSKLTCRTSDTFTAFNITARDYDIYFYGDDCVDGVLTGVADKYYEMEASHDGFEGLLVKVHSHALPTT